jgi:hypothetical protein
MEIRIGKRYDRQPPAFCEAVLRKFGRNRFGQNLYRVVWSDSMFEWRGGLWRDHLDDSASRDMQMPDGTRLETNPVVGVKPEYRSIAKYGNHPGRFILEKWMPTPCSREDWYRRYMDPDSGFCLLGPYPDKGAYHFCYELSLRGQHRELSAGLIEEYCRLIEAGHHYTPAEHAAACQADRDRKEKEWNDKFDGIWEESMPVGGVTKLFQAVSGPKSKDRTRIEDVKIGPQYEGPKFRQL